MKDLLFILAEAMPEQMILDELASSLQEYKLTNDKKLRDKSSMLMSIFLSKEVTAQVGGIDKMLNRSEKMQRGMELMDAMDGGKRDE